MQLLLLALATFVSEDLTCIGAGVLIAQGKLAFLPGVIACALGIFSGDLLLYFAGRLAGRALLRWRPLRRFLTEEKLDRASEWLDRRGSSVVLASRFTPGLRLPTYVAAGLLKTRFLTFAAYFLAAAVVWTPLLVGGTVLLGEGVLRSFYSHRGGGVFAFAVLAAASVSTQAFAGRARRLTRWEFWPPWLAYLPLVPYLLFLAVRHRSLTLFTAANPGIPSGGFVGESKSQILARLTHVPAFELLPATMPLEERRRRAAAFDGGRYPVVLKPDVGERGTGVAIVRTARELDAYLRTATVDTIIQRYVDGPEFGIFYYRYPGEWRGRIFSITEKRFPDVRGDGRSTIAELIANDPRARYLADVYLQRCRRAPASVPAAGERVSLAEIGSHCRGAIFLDGAYLETEALRIAIDGAAKSHPGFFFGRFDVRAASVADLQAGHFRILELNGVTAEATHIYDPAVSLTQAYRCMFTQWRIAFEIGAANRRAGARPMPARELAALIFPAPAPVTRFPSAPLGTTVCTI